MYHFYDHIHFGERTESKSCGTQLEVPGSGECSSFKTLCCIAALDCHMHWLPIAVLILGRVQPAVHAPICTLAQQGTELYVGKRAAGRTRTIVGGNEIQLHMHRRTGLSTTAVSAAREGLANPTCTAKYSEDSDGTPAVPAAMLPGSITPTMSTSGISSNSLSRPAGLVAKRVIGMANCNHNNTPQLKLHQLLLCTTAAQHLQLKRLLACNQHVAAVPAACAGLIKQLPKRLPHMLAATAVDLRKL